MEEYLKLKTLKSQVTDVKKVQAGKVYAEEQMQITTTGALEKDLTHDSEKTSDDEIGSKTDGNFEGNSYLDEGNTLRALFADEDDDTVMAPPGSVLCPPPQITNPTKKLAQTFLRNEDVAEEGTGLGRGGGGFDCWFD